MRNLLSLIIAAFLGSLLTAGDFMEQIESRKPGEAVELTILRNGQTITVRVILAGDDPAPRDGSQGGPPV